MNEEMCDEICEEYEYFLNKIGYRNSACYLTIALQIRKLSSSKKRY